MTTTMSPARRFPRGSEWRRWDLHVHTPESVLNNQFGDDWDTYVYRLFKAAIAHKISVIGITDYFSIEGYKKLNVEYLGQPERLKVMFCDELRADPNYLEKIGSILVLPNIEFRIDKFVQTKSEEGLSRLTMHVIFSDDVSIHDIEQNFLGNLKFSFRGVPQSKNEKRSLNIVNLEELGARLRGEQASFQKKSNLFVGCMTATVDDDEISDALCAAPSLFGNRHVLVLAEEYLSQVAWGGSGHQARKVLYQKCDVVFSSNEKTIALLASPSFAKSVSQ